MEPEGDFQVEPMCIMDRKEIVLQNGVVTRVRVQWNHFILKETNWVLEYSLWKEYPGLFPESMEDDWEHRGQCYNKGERM